MNAKTAHIIEVAIALATSALGLSIFTGIVWKYASEGDTEVAAAFGIIFVFTFSAVAGAMFDIIRDSRHDYLVKTGKRDPYRYWR